jgi:uncharacterized protein (TIGR03067 family)
MRTTRFVKSVAIGFALILISFFGCPAQARTWTEAETGRTLEGELVRVVREIALIRRTDGGTVQIPLTRLSEPDRTFIKEKLTPAAPPEDPADSGKEGLKKQLAGTWEGSIVNSDGSPQGGIRLVITESEITATNPGGQPMGAGTYSVSGSGKAPHRIDTKGTAGQYEGKDYEGIFSIEGKTLRWCSTNDRGRPRRPDKLQTDIPAGHFLMVLEKKS